MLVTTQYVSEAEYCDRVALIADGELVALDTPDELRKLVFGGEMLEVTTERAVDADVIGGVPGITDVRQAGARQLFVTTENAATTTPLVIEALRQAGIGVIGLEEHQPTFDEVFTQLVEQRRATRDQEVVRSQGPEPVGARGG